MSLRNKIITLFFNKMSIISRHDIIQRVPIQINTRNRREIDTRGFQKVESHREKLKSLLSV